MLFNTIFSQLFSVSTSQNDLQIELFFNIFGKRRFCENPYETLAMRTKIKVRTSKKPRKIDAKPHLKQASPKTVPQIDFRYVFASENLPKSLQNRPGTSIFPKCFAIRFAKPWTVRATRPKSAGLGASTVSQGSLKSLCLSVSLSLC